MSNLVAVFLAALATNPAPVALPQETAPAVQVAPKVGNEEAALERRLALLVERMEAERVAQHIPGFALAVVQGDEVVLARGFGVADVETGRLVDAETLFAIGSSSKAFTGVLAGMLQDDGVLSIDDPVTKYLPYFQLPIEGPDAKGDATVTLRDLMSHRTGFTRMSVLWGSGGASREEILRTAIRAEPWAGFREKFYYNNVMYLAAGVAIAAAAESDWGDLIHTRIFEPLGMSSSTLSVHAAQKDERLSLGYEWDAETETFHHESMMELETIGPAGAINSNVLDMAQWLRLQLGHGELEGQRLIGAATLEETWTSNIEIQEGVGYGLGWMLHERQGQRVIEHGGNIAGFGAEVAFMPEAGVGFVLLTNVTGTPLQQLSLGIVFDALLEEPGVETGAGEFAEYIGDYRANFASFQDAKFEVLVQNGNLAIDVPGQMVYELRAPDETGKWFFRLTDTIAIGFVRDAKDRVVGLNMYQSGMTFELPRDGVEVEREAEIPLDQLAKFLGTYRSADLDFDFTVVIANQRLAVDIPDQMVFELHVPDADGKRRFRVSDELAVSFHEDETGKVTAMTLFEGADVREATRVEGDAVATGPALPSVDEVATLRGLDGRAQLLAKHGTLRTTGTVRLAQSGLEGTFVFEAREEPQAARLRMDFGDFGVVEYGGDAHSAWTATTARGYQVLHGVRAQQTQREFPSIAGGDLRAAFDHLEVVEVTEREGRELILVSGRWGELPPRILFLDAETGDVVHVEHVYADSLMQIPMETTYSDFREDAGVSLYHVAEEVNEQTGRTIRTTLEVLPGVELAPDFYVYAD